VSLLLVSVDGCLHLGYLSAIEIIIIRVHLDVWKAPTASARRCELDVHE
jgi:hypothetical protein